MGKCSREQKREMIARFTSAAVEITKIPETEFTVTITELEHDNLGRGGKTLTDIFAARKTV
jgi:4-oxalocrotonate tautomerase family enzyme